MRPVATGKLLFLLWRATNFACRGVDADAGDPCLAEGRASDAGIRNGGRARFFKGMRLVNRSEAEARSGRAPSAQDEPLRFKRAQAAAGMGAQGDGLTQDRSDHMPHGGKHACMHRRAIHHAFGQARAVKGGLSRQSVRFAAVLGNMTMGSA